MKKLEKYVQYVVLVFAVLSFVLGFFSEPTSSKAAATNEVTELAIPEARESAQKVMISETEYLRIYPDLFGSNYVKKIRAEQAAKQQAQVQSRESQQAARAQQTANIPFPMMEITGFSSAKNGITFQTRQGAGVKPVRFVKKNGQYVYEGPDFTGFLVTVEDKGIRLTSNIDSTISQVYQYDVKARMEQFKTK